MPKRSGKQLENDLPCKKERLLQLASFDWLTQCFLCGEKENLKKGNKFSIVSQDKSENIRTKVLRAAAARKDETIENLVGNAAISNLYHNNARYHFRCYRDYTNEKNITTILNESKRPTTAEIYDDIAKNVVLNNKDKFESGEIVFLPQLCEDFIQGVVERGVKSQEEAKNIKSSFIKSKLMKVTDIELQFHSYHGKPDIVVSSKFPLVLLVHKLFENQNKSRNDYVKNTNDKCNKDSNNECVIIHQAAALIRREIDKIPKTTDYFLPNEITLDYSKKFVPDVLQKLISWVLDKNSFSEGQLSDDEKTFRRVLSISETIIYCSRRSRNNSVIPPFQFGFTLLLHHKFGKKSLINILNSHGFCCTNDDLRYFLTTAAEKELEKNETVYVPYGIIHRNNGGGLIQEGDDNVDINTQTMAKTPTTLWL